jgi:hypothetical protein
MPAIIGSVERERRMGKTPRLIWPLILVVLGICNAAQLALLIISFSVPREGERGTKCKPVEMDAEERAEAAARRCAGLERLLRERLSALDGSAIEELRRGRSVEAAVAARLDEKRAESRSRFTAEMIWEIENSLGRRLDSEDRAEIAAANRRYFDRVDDGSEDETAAERGARLAGAARARTEAIANVASDRDDPNGIVSRAMNSL